MGAPVLPWLLLLLVLSHLAHAGELLVSLQIPAVVSSQPAVVLRMDGCHLHPALEGTWGNRGILFNPGFFS